MATLTVTQDNFESDVLRGDKPVLVDFWAEWCGPCRMIAPALEEISEELDGKIAIAKINIEDDPDLATQFGVRSVPTLLVFKDGQVVASKLGAAPKAALKSWIESAI